MWRLGLSFKNDMGYNMDMVICEEQLIQYWVWWQVRCGAVDKEVFESVRACDTILGVVAS